MSVSVAPKDYSAASAGLSPPSAEFISETLGKEEECMHVNIQIYCILG